MLDQCLAGEWARYGIAVNTMAPGYVETDILSNSDGGSNTDWVKKWTDMTPFGRFGKPSEIGEMIVLMLSDKASGFMTGHELVMDGGKLFVPHKESEKLTGAQVILHIDEIMG